MKKEFDDWGLEQKGTNRRRHREIFIGCSANRINEAPHHKRNFFQRLNSVMN